MGKTLRYKKAPSRHYSDSNQFALHLLDLQNRTHTLERLFNEMHTAVQNMLTNMGKNNQGILTRFEGSERRIKELENLVVNNKGDIEVSEDDVPSDPSTGLN